MHISYEFVDCRLLGYKWIGAWYIQLENFKEIENHVFLVYYEKPTGEKH
jgi:hypothetical protein